MARRCLFYYITDRSQFPGNESARRGALLAKIAEAARASVDYIQLREKDLSAKALENLARDALTVLGNSATLRFEGREARTRFLINSRTDIALAAGADGVHLRSDDIAVHEVRRVLQVAHWPPNGSFLVATSCHTSAEVHRAESENVDLAVFAPVFGKKGSSGTPPAGLTLLCEAGRAKTPLLALGGVTLANAASCLEAGAAGIAGIRLFQENKIEDVVRALRAH
jgi:thiamine-phosphate pyrophosphorylase